MFLKKAVAIREGRRTKVEATWLEDCPQEAHLQVVGAKDETVMVPGTRDRVETHYFDTLEEAKAWMERQP